MNERPIDFPLPLPQTAPKSITVGNKDGRVLFIFEGYPPVALSVAHAAILSAKIMGECAIACNRVSQEAVDAAFKQVEQEKQKPKIILPPSNETAS